MSAYAYLIVRREWRDVVDYPDGTSSEHPSGDGADVAAAWNAEHPVEVRPEAAVDEQAAWDARLKEHMRATVWHIQDPVVRQERYEAERAAFVLADPPPGEGEHPSAPSGRAGVRDQQFWHARLLTRPAREPLILAPGDAQLPRLAVTDHLEALDAEGWRVLHVAEERSVDHDGDQSRTRLDGLSILLCNDQRRVG